MDRVKLGLEKAYRGWGIPGHLYSRQGEILAAGQEEQFALPRKLLAELFAHMEKWDGPSVYSEPSGVCLMLFFVGENLAVLGPVAVRRITEMEGKRYLFERIRTKIKLEIPYVPYIRAVSCLSTACFLATGDYHDEKEFLQLTDATGEELRTEVLRNTFYHEEEEENRYSYSDELKWLSAIERGELENPDDVDLTSMFEHLYRVGVLTIQGDLKQAEYMMVVAITLASRAAIRGGADPFMAYQVSDVYLQKLSGCDNLRDMGKTGLEGVSAFNTLVRQHLESVGGNPYCEKTKTYVVRHIREKIRMKDIAEHVGLSGSYLASLFQKEEGISIKQYIMQERLSLATNLLKNTDESIGTISDYLAFNSQSYFTSHFRERYGMTPTEYRQKYTKLAM